MRNCTKIYIDGAWVASTSGEVIDVINPATEQVAGKSPRAASLTLIVR